MTNLMCRSMRENHMTSIFYNTRKLQKKTEAESISYSNHCPDQIWMMPLMISTRICPSFPSTGTMNAWHIHLCRCLHAHLYRVNGACHSKYTYDHTPLADGVKGTMTRTRGQQGTWIRRSLHDHTPCNRFDAGLSYIIVVFISSK